MGTYQTINNNLYHRLSIPESIYIPHSNIATTPFLVRQQQFNNRSLSSLTTTTPTIYEETKTSSPGLEQFRDTIPRDERSQVKVGRAWSVKELRRKSYDDLHKLWYVLYKESNMLNTEKRLAVNQGVLFPQPERRKKVRDSMKAIKHVLGERKRERIAQQALRIIEKKEAKNKEVELNNGNADN